MHPLINVVTKIVRDAGKIILRNLDRLNTIVVKAKAENDFVTEVDQAVEVFIKDALLERYPDYAFWGEESGMTGEKEYCWICDPIDGTANFMRGIPHFCISLALKKRDKIEHAIIFDPVRQEIFTASLGEGAFLNNHRIRVNQNEELKRVMVAISGKPEVLAKAPWLPALYERTVNCRRMGSAALDCAYVASGRCDVGLGTGLAIWDFAAGLLLIQEAGGVVTSFEGELFSSGNLLAGNVRVVRELSKVWGDCGEN